MLRLIQQACLLAAITVISYCTNRQSELVWPKIVCFCISLELIWFLCLNTMMFSFACLAQRVSNKHKAAAAPFCTKFNTVCLHCLSFPHIFEQLVCVDVCWCICGFWKNSRSTFQMEENDSYVFLSVYAVGNICPVGFLCSCHWTTDSHL